MAQGRETERGGRRGGGGRDDRVEGVQVEFEEVGLGLLVGIENYKFIILERRLEIWRVSSSVDAK
jgi:hypothetical protein